MQKAELIKLIQSQNPGMLKKMPNSETDYWDFQAQIIQDILDNSSLTFKHANLSVFPYSMVLQDNIDVHVLAFTAPDAWEETNSENIVEYLGYNYHGEGIETCAYIKDSGTLFLIMNMSI